MILPRLTNPAHAARTALMRSRVVRSKAGTGRFLGRATGAVVLLGGVMALSGCISVNAPDKPIVIELNINIKQEVIYRLANDVKENIESNPEIF